MERGRHESVKLKNRNCVMAKEKGNVNGNPQTMFLQLDLKITSRNFLKQCKLK